MPWVMEHLETHVKEFLCGENGKLPWLYHQLGKYLNLNEGEKVFSSCI